MVAPDRTPSSSEFTEHRVTLIMRTTGCSRRRALALDALLPAEHGAVEATIRQAVAELTASMTLTGTQSAFAEIAYRLARQLDQEPDEGSTGLAGISREIRQAMAAIWQGVKVERPSDTFGAGLATPHR